jgi:siroheme synthase-like protein
VNLILSGRRCLVVGGGEPAAQKVRGLLACGAIVDVVAEQVGADIRASAASWSERPYRQGDVAGYWLAVAATDDSDVRRKVFEDGEAHKVWVNSADDPDSCSFTLPAVLRRGDLLVTASTSGRSPAVASWLRDRMAAEIGPEYGALLDLVASARDAMRMAGRSTEGVDWRIALDSDMLELVKNGQIDRARERLQACLSSSSD